MKKIKRCTAICLSVFLALLSLSFPSFALQEEPFDINNISWDDIMTMSNSDFRQLLAYFEREYDPLETYNTSPLMSENISSGKDVQPRWVTGNGEDTTGSHELITARACGILLDDKGFWGGNENGSILIALTISLASIIPDKEWEMGLGDGFRGHFYDPDTNMNYDGQTDNTAKTNATYYYNLAKEVGYNDDNFVRYVGCMLHYIQDVCVPHHAANIKSWGPLSAHYQFEKLADENLNSYIDSYTTIPNGLYSDSLTKTIDVIVHESAVLAKGYSEVVDNLLLQSNWGTVALNTTRNAVMYSALALYKLSIEEGIPLMQA